jgi:ribonuclease P protein component
MSFKLRTLKKRADFLRARSGRHHVAPGLILQAVRQAGDSRGVLAHAEPGTAGNWGDRTPADAADDPRFGFTVTKKLGKAVIRNRIKRRLREAVRLVAPRHARAGFEYVLIGKASTLKRPFKSLLHDLAVAFGKVHGDARASGPKGSGERRKPPAPETRKL